MITVRVFLCAKCWLSAGSPPVERHDTAGCASCAPGTLMECRLVHVAISDPKRWDGPPYAGERYVRGKELRTVSDRRLGGDVLYYTGQARRRHHECTLAEWYDWARRAVKLARE